MVSKNSKNPKSKKAATIQANAVEGEYQKDYFYLDKNTRRHDFSDFVRIQSYPRGIILSFGRWCAEENKFGIFQDILIPFDVADSLKSIIGDHIKVLVDKGHLEIKTVRKEDVE